MQNSNPNEAWIWASFTLGEFIFTLYLSYYFINN